MSEIFPDVLAVFDNVLEDIHLVNDLVAVSLFLIIV